MTLKCLNCGSELDSFISNDGLGWHSYCEKCGIGFDVNIEEYLIPNGTKVKFADEKIGIVDGNDKEETEEFKDINYYVCPIEFTNEESWSNHYVMLLRNEFEIIKD